MSPDFQSRPPARRITTLDAVLWVVAVLLFCLSVHETWTKTGDLRRARASVDALRAGVRSDEARLGRIRQDAAQMDARLAGRIILTQDAPPERVLAALERFLPAGARFDSVTLEYGETLGVTLSVVARRSAIFDEFLRRLESSADFTNIAFGVEAREGEVRVSVSAVYRGSAAS
jgi:hypothetical protein